VITVINPLRKVITWLDSQAAICRIKNNKGGPGHKGIVENEKADLAAKEGARKGRKESMVRHVGIVSGGHKQTVKRLMLESSRWRRERKKM
jgi:hypothetical protein